MKYRLKDRALQEKLDAMTKGGFSKVLEKGIDPTFFCEEFLLLGVGDIRVRIYESALEEVPEYDPNNWNRYPEVTPPEGVPMRVEYRRPDGTIGRCCSFFREGVWEDSEDQDLEIINVQRFRPWEDPDEEDKE